jgi:hypothetical protein
MEGPIEALLNEGDKGRGAVALMRSLVEKGAQGKPFGRGQLVSVQAYPLSNFIFRTNSSLRFRKSGLSH